MRLLPGGLVRSRHAELVTPDRLGCSSSRYFGPGGTAPDVAHQPWRSQENGGGGQRPDSFSVQHRTAAARMAEIYEEMLARRDITASKPVLVPPWRERQATAGLIRTGITVVYRSLKRSRSTAASRLVVKVILSQHAFAAAPAQVAATLRELHQRPNRPSQPLHIGHRK